jgi:hypothetical protein
VAVTRVKTLGAGAVNVSVALSMGDRLPSAAPLAGALATGFFGYGVSIVLHLLALRQIGTARQAAYLATAPFVRALAAVPILGERLTVKESVQGWSWRSGWPSPCGPDTAIGMSTMPWTTTTLTSTTSTTITRRARGCR